MARLLDPKIAEDIIEKHRQLERDEELPTRDALTGYYRTFRSQFGPDIVSSAEGSDLLDLLYFNGTKDNLAYWLEFKNDEEFPSTWFGGIGGGSALKFGLYLGKESNEWMVRDEHNYPKAIAREQAVEIAEKHRKQLVHGANRIAELPESASQSDYYSLQSDLAKLAPDLFDLGWCHKYWSLLFPTRLDDYHNLEWQKFGLIKLGIVPPENLGRYSAAYYYLTLSRDFGIPVSNLTRTLGVLNGKPHKYWRIGTRVRKHSIWDEMQQGSFAAIGWPALGDLSSLERNSVSKEKLGQLLEAKYPGDPRLLGRYKNQVFKFVTHMAPPDLIVAADGEQVLGIGRVVGEYQYVEGSDWPHRRKVKWLSHSPWKLPHQEGLRTAVHQLKKHPANLVEVERNLAQSPGPGPSPGPEPEPLRGTSGAIESILRRKGQVILYGPPGTGKTYWADRTAKELAARDNFHKTSDSLNEAERDTIMGNGPNTGLVRYCCFHPEYGYENFIEGYRPKDEHGQVSFELRDGVFKQLCKDAEKTPQKNYYLVIDEINRGDIPRIFGELITLLEIDKRGRAFQLPVSGDFFLVPRNVFVIGTMNTADRSIALLDIALRRRFGFVELMPDATVLEDKVLDGIPVRLWLKALNRRIRENVGKDGRNLQIGHSYFMPGGRTVETFAQFAEIMRNDIVPLLEEYCYEDYELLGRLLGTALVDTSAWRVRHELFDSQDPTSLASALVAPSPEISASLSAVVEPEEEILEEEDDTDDEI